MGWDYNQTLSNIGDDLSSVLQSQYGLTYAKQTSPLLQQNFSKIVVPLIILGIVFVFVLKKKAW